MAADPRAIVECLLAARYSEHEIVDYLVGTLGISEPAAFAALDGVRAPRFR